jgi:curved DNA-binding protein
MKYKDYYETMGVPRTATQDEIKAAHRKLARKFHPDLNKDANAETRFKEVGEAYQVLKDPETRAAYDRLGTGPGPGEDFRPPPNWNDGFEYSGRGDEGAETSEFSDFFESIFGRNSEGPGAGQQRRRAPLHSAGQDHHAKVMIDLRDTFTGAQRAITLQMPVADAHGRVSMQARELNVSIPKGIRAGQRMRLAGQGGAGLGQGPAGDLYLEIEWREPMRYRVDGRDVSLDLPVAPWEAALGAEVTVPAPDSDVSMTIPPDSANGRRLRLKGRGIPGTSSATPAGDLYVVLSVVLPSANTEAAKKAYGALRDAFKFDPRAHFQR